MSEQPMIVRAMTAADRWEVAEVICVSFNTWCQAHGRAPIFTGGPRSAVHFFDVYESLDPGCGVVAVSPESGRLAAVCFFHPRPTHVSLGIMAAHPNYFGRGAARRVIDYIVKEADRRKLPARLVSSAMNLDSFSLYTRFGFVAHTAYQDMLIAVPEEGFLAAHRPKGIERVREATLADVPAIVELECEIAGIRRNQDFRYFLENREGFWHLSVYENEQGRLEGFMASSGQMIGPGATRTSDQAVALLAAELDRCRGRSPVTLVPVACGALVAQMYQWGARNCELHFAQARGKCQPPAGLHFPTFLPESG
jgi:GNAT superfamily N-acetyltransferase